MRKLLDAYFIVNPFDTDKAVVFLPIAKKTTRPLSTKGFKELRDLSPYRGQSYEKVPSTLSSIADAVHSVFPMDDIVPMSMTWDEIHRALSSYKGKRGLFEMFEDLDPATQVTVSNMIRFVDDPFFVKDVPLAEVVTEPIDTGSIDTLTVHPVAIEASLFEKATTSNELSEDQRAYLNEAFSDDIIISNRIPKWVDYPYDSIKLLREAVCFKGDSCIVTPSKLPDEKTILGLLEASGCSYKDEKSIQRYTVECSTRSSACLFYILLTFYNIKIHTSNRSLAIAYAYGSSHVEVRDFSFRSVQTQIAPVQVQLPFDMSFEVSRDDPNYDSSFDDFTGYVSGRNVSLSASDIRRIRGLVRKDSQDSKDLTDRTSFVTDLFKQHWKVLIVMSIIILYVTVSKLTTVFDSVNEYLSRIPVIGAIFEWLTKHSGLTDTAHFYVSEPSHNYYPRVAVVSQYSDIIPRKARFTCVDGAGNLVYHGKLDFKSQAILYAEVHPVKMYQDIAGSSKVTIGIEQLTWDGTGFVSFSGIILETGHRVTLTESGGE